MTFDPHIGNIKIILQDYGDIVEAERGRIPGIEYEVPSRLDNGELIACQRFPAQLVELEVRLSLLHPTVEPSLSVSLRFQKKGEVDITRGVVGVRGVPFRHEKYGITLAWDVFAQREAPCELPQGAKRLTSRLRARLRTKEDLGYKSLHQQLVSTIFLYALQGERSLA